MKQKQKDKMGIIFFYGLFNFSFTPKCPLSEKRRVIHWGTYIQRYILGLKLGKAMDVLQSTWSMNPKRR